MEEYVWGLDLSMRCVGISIFDLKGSFVKVFSVTTKDKNSHGERLKVIADYILELKERYPAKVVVIERGFSRFNISTAVIYRVHGLINFLFWDVIQIYYPPKTVKESVLNGNATKKQLQENIISKYPNIKFDNEDESDAFSVGLCYFVKNGIVNWK